MIAIIDYDAGNLKSVEKALQSIGEDTIVSRDREEILRADKVILPGVGSFGDAMQKLRDYKLDEVIKEVTAIFVRDGRLLLFAVTDLNNEADHTDHENTKLEQFRVCNHKSLAPLSMCRRAQKDVLPSANAVGSRPLAVYR